MFRAKRSLLTSSGRRKDRRDPEYDAFDGGSELQPLAIEDCASNCWQPLLSLEHVVIYNATRRRAGVLVERTEILVLLI